MASNFKVRLISVLNNIASSDGRFTRQEVVFENTPAFSENGSVEYTAVQPVHMPGAVQIYKNTAPRTFSINSKLISRTRSEAMTNMVNVQLLRSWRYPFFGQQSRTFQEGQITQNQKKAVDGQLLTAEDKINAAQLEGTEITDVQLAEVNTLRIKSESGGFELLGAPPEVLYLYAYSSPDTDRAQVGWVNINRIPVVLTNLDITFPEDVDYLPNAFGQPWPVRIDVNIALAETHSPREFEQFSLIKFKTGQLDFF